MEEESGGKKVASFERFICEREWTVYLILSCIFFSQWKDYRIRLIWWKFRVLVTARAAECRTSWRRLVCVEGRLSRRALQWSFEWIREVATVQAVFWSILVGLRIRVKSRIFLTKECARKIQRKVFPTLRTCICYIFWISRRSTKCCMC